MTTVEVSEYRLAPLLIARFVGLYLVLLAIVVFGATVLVAVLELPMDLLVVLLLVGIVGLFGLGWWLRSRVVVVRFDDAGYRVRMVRGAGVTEARWTDVEDAVTATHRDSPCVVLRLKDGRTTIVPVQVLAADREAFARDVRSRLRTGGEARPQRRKR